MAQEKILIIEDDPSIASLIRINLEFENYHPVVAENGETGLIRAGSEKPDLILLDVMLPEMNGFEVLQYLKNSPDTTQIPVIMLTALGQQQDLKKGYDLGAMDYITKPFSINRLLSAVESQLRKPEQSQERAASEEAIPVAIVGAGEDGTYLLNVLQADPHFKIVGISDLNPDKSGIQLARRLNIPIYDDITFFAREIHADCVFATDREHYEVIHARILNINSQEIIGPLGLEIFLHVIRHLETKEKVTRTVLREYKQVVE